MTIPRGRETLKSKIEISPRDGRNGIIYFLQQHAYVFPVTNYNLKQSGLNNDFVQTYTQHLSIRL